MKYEITYTNSSHSHVCEHVYAFNGKANAREFVGQSRRYPGSIEIHSVVKVTPKGTRTHVDL